MKRDDNDAYTRAIQNVTPGSIVGAAKEIGNTVFGQAPSERTYANSSSFPDPQDNPESGPVTNVGYTPASGDEPGRFTANTAPAAGPLAAAEQTVQRPAANPVSVAISGQPRQLYGNEGRGNGQPDRSGDRVATAAAPKNSFDNRDAPAGFAGDHEAYAKVVSDYNAMKAREAQGVQDAGNAMQRHADWASNWAANNAIADKARTASGDARVANWNREMARIDVASGQTRGTRDGTVASLALADRAAQEANAIPAIQAPAPVPGTRNFVQEDVARQAAAQSAQAAQLSQQQGKQGLVAGKQNIESGGVDLQQKKQQLAAATALTTAKTPEDRAAAQQNYLALHGKTEPGWHAISFGGQQIADPETGQVRTVGGNVMLYNQFTGQKELHTAQEATNQTAAPAAKTYPDGTKGKIDGKPVVWKNGKPVPQQ